MSTYVIFDAKSDKTSFSETSDTDTYNFEGQGILELLVLAILMDIAIQLFKNKVLQ